MAALVSQIFWIPWAIVGPKGVLSSATKFESQQESLDKNSRQTETPTVTLVPIGLAWARSG